MHLSRKTLLVAWVLLTAGAAGANDVRADPVTFQFSGRVHHRTGIAPQAVDDLLFGSLTVDPAQLATTEQGESFRRFEGPVDLALSFRRGGAPVLEYNLPDQRMNLVVNNAAGDLAYDAFRPIVFDPALTFTFGFFFTDRSGNALPSTDFPRTLDLQAFDATRLFFGDYWSGRRNLPPLGTFNGAITSLNGINAPDQPGPVPEPASIILVGTALVGLGVRRRARLKRAFSQAPL